MRYMIEIAGTSPLICNNGEGVDKFSDLSIAIGDINKRKPTTKADAVERSRLEAERAIYWHGETAQPTLPAGMLRACIEGAARTRKQGPLVRQGLTVESVERFTFDRNRIAGDTNNRRDVAAAYVFVTGVKQAAKRIERGRARFPLPWSVRFIVDADPEIIEEAQLRTWLDIAGRRIGIGDWRRQTSGDHGCFKIVSIDAIT